MRSINGNATIRATNLFLVAALLASASLFAGGAPADPVPTPGACASGVVTQQFYDRVAGCAGNVAQKDAAKLCGAGFTLATAQQWMNAHHQLKPTHHYWVSDKLDRDTYLAWKVARPAGKAIDCGDASMHVCAAGTATDPEGNHCGFFDCGWDPLVGQEFVFDEYFGGCTTPDTTAGALCAGPPPSWDQLQIDITTGADDARASSEIIAGVTGEPGTLCLKPSDSRSPDGICPNGSPSITWGPGSVSHIFTLPIPQTSLAAFGALTITLLQGPCTFCTSDNWNIEAIRVIARDSTGVAPPRVLLDLASGVRPDSNSCIARLKDRPNATSVRFSLAFGPTNEHVYADGPAGVVGHTTTCN